MFEQKFKNSAYREYVDGYVYFVKDLNGYMKIGCTKDFKKRLSSLKNKYGELVAVRVFESIDIYNLERIFHYKFKEKRVHGEWFDVSEQEIKEMKLNCLEIEFVKGDFNG